MAADPPVTGEPAAAGGGDGLELAPGVRVPEDAVRFQFARAGGPGGQNVNKLNTKAELWVALDRIVGLDDDARARLRRLAGRRVTTAGELHLTATTERTQERNRAAVLDRLRLLVAESIVAPVRRRKTRPTGASKRRRLDAKRRRAQTKSGRRDKGDD